MRTSPAPVQHLPQAVHANFRGGSAYKLAKALLAAMLTCGGDWQPAPTSAAWSGRGAQASAASTARLAEPGPRRRCWEKPAQARDGMGPISSGGRGGPGGRGGAADSVGVLNGDGERTVQR